MADKKDFREVETNVEEIEENIKYLMSNEFEKYDNKFAIEQFKQIKEETLKLSK